MGDADKDTDACKATLELLSSDLQKQLAQKLADPGEFQQPRILSTLQLDDATREKLREELKLKPDMPRKQVGTVLMQAFQVKLKLLERFKRATIQSLLPGLSNETSELLAL